MVMCYFEKHVDVTLVLSVCWRVLETRILGRLGLENVDMSLAV